MLLEESDDVRQRRAGAEDAGHAHFEEFGDVGFGDDAADQNADVAEAGVAQELQDARHQGHVAPLRMLRPSQSASSSATARTTASGVCHRPA